MGKKEDGRVRQWFVGVYGSLRRDQHNHGYMQGEFVQNDVINGRLGKIAVKDGFLPAIRLDGDTEYVDVEIFRVSLDELELLDRFEHNNRVYKRKLVRPYYFDGRIWVYEYMFEKYIVFEGKR